MTSQRHDAATSESCWSPHCGVRWWAVRVRDGWDVRISTRDGAVLWNQMLDEKAYDFFKQIATDRSTAERHSFPVEDLERDANAGIAEQIQEITEPLGAVADIFLKIPHWYDEGGYEPLSSF